MRLALRGLARDAAHAANSGPGFRTGVCKIDIDIDTDTDTDIHLVMTCAMPQAGARGRHDQLRLLILG